MLVKSNWDMMRFGALYVTGDGAMIVPPTPFQRPYIMCQEGLPAPIRKREFPMVVLRSRYSNYYA